MSLTTYINPWTNITWKDTIASCDRPFMVNVGKTKVRFDSVNYINHINKNDEGKDDRDKIDLTFDALPEPFFGDINSKVYCLGMNPGKPDADFCESNDKSKIYESQAQEVLCQEYGRPSPSASYIFDDLMFDGSVIYKDNKAFDSFFSTNGLGSFKTSVIPRPHAGAIWQRILWKPLQDVLNRIPGLFFIEYFPYHSNRSFRFPNNLPSYEYSNWLIERAMDDKKIIIIMRKEEDWYNRIPNLKKYDNKILLRPISRGLRLAPNNFVRQLELAHNPIPGWACQTIKDMLKMM